MPTAPAQLLRAWSEVFTSPVITELAPGRVWEVATKRGDRYVLKKVSTFGAPDPVRRFAGEARILAHLLQRGVPVAVPVLSDDGKACAVGDDGAIHAVFPMLPSRGAAGGPVTSTRSGSPHQPSAHERPVATQREEGVNTLPSRQQ